MLQNVSITKVEYTPVTSPSKNGVVQIFVGSKFYTLAFPYKQKENGEIAAKHILENYGDESRKQRYEKDNEGIVFDLVGVRGRTMKVFQNRVVIKTAATLGNLFIGNATDEEKTIYYSDCIGVQFKESGVYTRMHFGSKEYEEFALCGATSFRCGRIKEV